MGSAFRGLLRKEWVVVRLGFLFTTIGLLVGWLISFGFSIYYKEPGISVVVTTILLGIHIFYFTVFLLSSLIMESKSHLWLHSPQSTTSLLFSKILTGIYLQVLSFVIFVAAMVILVESTKYLDSFSYLSFIVSGGLGITVSGIELGLYLMFYWAVYHAVGAVALLKKFRVLFFFLFVILFHSLLVFIENTAFIGFISGLWPLPLEHMNGLYFNVGQNGGSFYTDSKKLPIGYVLLYFIRTMFYFFITSWLLEKVVETK
ncbi:MAG: hypothetical protein ACQEV7_10725 [Bacillota bacterium]